MVRSLMSDMSHLISLADSMIHSSTGQVCACTHRTPGRSSFLGVSEGSKSHSKYMDAKTGHMLAVWRAS